MCCEYKTPILKVVATLYGNMGITLTAVQWSNNRSVLHFFWNLLVNLTNIATILFLDPFEMSSARKHCNPLNSKPLFIFFSEFCTGLFFPVMSIGIASVFVFRGRQMMQMLDTEPFYHFYSGNAVANFLFTGITLLYQFVFVSLLYYKLQFSRTEVWKLVLEVLALYCISSYAYLILFMLHYTQYGILGILRHILARLSRQGRMEILSSELNQMRAQIRTVSLINSRLCNTVASMLFVYSIPHIFNLILAITVNIVCQKALGLFLKWIFSFAYLFHLATLNSAVLATYQNIVELVTRRSRPQLSTRPSCGSTSTGSALELPIHYQDLSLRVFSLVTINRRLLLKMLLLVSCQVVFFTQTTA